MAHNLLVVGGDTLFLKDFDTKNTLDTFVKRYQQKDPTASMLLAYQTDDVGASKCGILETDDGSKVGPFARLKG